MLLRRIFSIITDLLLIQLFYSFLFNAFNLFIQGKGMAFSGLLAGFLSPFVVIFLPRLILKRPTPGMYFFHITLKKNQRKGNKKRSADLSRMDEVLRLITNLLYVFLLFIPLLSIFFTEKRTHVADWIVQSFPQNSERYAESTDYLIRFFGLIFVVSSLALLFSSLSFPVVYSGWGKVWKGSQALIIVVLYSLLLLTLSFSLLRFASKAYLFLLIFTIIRLADVSSAFLRMDTYKKETLLMFHEQAAKALQKDTETRVSPSVLKEWNNIVNQQGIKMMNSMGISMGLSIFLSLIPLIVVSGRSFYYHIGGVKNEG